MKKIISVFLIMALILTFTTCIFATEEIIEPTTDDVNEITEGATEESIIDKAINTLKNSSVWISVGGVMVSMVSILGGAKFIINKLSNIANLIRNKADKTTITNALTETKTEIKKEIEKIIAENEKEKRELKCSNEELKKILIFLVSYSTNINPHAKNTMLAILSGAKIVTGDLAEFVSYMESEVKNASQSEVKDQTPNLDKVVGESEAN